MSGSTLITFLVAVGQLALVVAVAQWIRASGASSWPVSVGPGSDCVSLLGHESSEIAPDVDWWFLVLVPERRRDRAAPAISSVQSLAGVSTDRLVVVYEEGRRPPGGGRSEGILSYVVDSRTFARLGAPSTVATLLIIGGRLAHAAADVVRPAGAWVHFQPFIDSMARAPVWHVSGEDGEGESR